MTKAEILAKTREHIKEGMGGDKTGHDWWHIYRVTQLAKRLAKEEGADPFVTELGALLHDIADWKFTDGDFEAGPRESRKWLESLGADEEVIQKVEYIVRHVSFRGGTNEHVMQTIEGKVVQDADRLDALGAIGVVRTFTFGGAYGREVYDPAHSPHKYKDFEDYKKHMHASTTINHFYEKLLLIKDRLNTDSARRIAAHRHKYLEDFLEEFYTEWEGKK